MNIFPLPMNEFAERGFTHVFKLTWDDDMNVAAVTTTIALYSAGIGVAIYDAILHVDEEFSVPGDRTTLLITVGDGDDVDRYLTSTQTLATQVAYTLGTGTKRIYNAADTVDAVLTLSGGASGNLEDLTTGVIWIGLHIVDGTKIKQDSRG